VDPPLDQELVSQPFELPGCHPFGGHKEVMKAGRPGETYLQGSAQDGLRLTEAVLGMFNRKKLEETLRAHTGPSGEEPLEMKWAQAHVSSHIVQSGLGSEFLLQETDGLSHRIII